MDPDERRTSTRAVLLAAAGQNCWPPAGSYMAATGQDLMAADTAKVQGQELPQNEAIHGTSQGRIAKLLNQTSASRGN